MGYILLSFLDNYTKLSNRIVTNRTTEQKPHREIAIIDAKELQANVTTNMKDIVVSLQKPPISASNQSQQISEVDSKALDDAYKNVTLTATNESKDELKTVIAKAVKTESAKETKSKPKLSVERKAKITHDHVTQELVDTVYEPRAHKLLKAIHETKSSAESETLVVELQKLIKIKDDGAFGTKSVATLHTFNQSSKEYGSEMTKFAQDAVKDMPIDALKKNYITIANTLAQPNQPSDTVNRLSYLLGHINTKAQKNGIDLSQGIAAEQIQTVIVTGKRQSTPDTMIAQSKGNETKLTKFENFVKNREEGNTFVTSDSPNITFKFEKNRYLYSVKNGFAPVTKQAVLTAFNGKPSALMLAEEILKNKNESQKA